MILLTALLGLAAEPDPVARWEVFDDDSLCTLARAYPGAGDGVVVNFMPWPLANRTEITVVTDGSDGDIARGPGRLVSDAGGRAEGRRNASALGLVAPHFGRGTLTIGQAAPIAGGVASGIEPARTPDDIDLRVTTIDLPVEMPVLSEGATMTIASDVVATPPIVLTDVAAALAKLRACQVAQLTRWGIDPDERAKIATPMEPAPGMVTGWFSSDNYPKDALKRREQGIVIVRWTIGTDGRTSDCAPVQSSGLAALDAAACKVILSHRYSAPARDAAGAPMVSHGMRRVAWRIPQY